MEILKFIKQNKDWETIISNEPYNISIKKDNGYIILFYNQISSDFTIPMVRECRGIILKETNYEPVCVPFFKFGNYGEEYADKLDWSTVCVQEKIDGSLMKLWYDNGEWHISTNKTIDAKRAEINTILINTIFDNCHILNYYDLFKIATKDKIDYNKLNKSYTYMFEIVSPYNRIVVNYPEIDIYHIGTRDNVSFKELNVNIGIKKPKLYNFHNLNDCIDSLKNVDYNTEGYVAVDQYWHRNKIKSPAWIIAHHIQDNGQINTKKIIDLIRCNDQEEFLTYFPEYKDKINEVKFKIDLYISCAEQVYINFNKKEYANRKEFAEEAQKTKCADMLFSLKDHKFNNVEEWFWSMRTDKIIKELYNER